MDCRALYEGFENRKLPSSYQFIKEAHHSFLCDHVSSNLTVKTYFGLLSLQDNPGIKALSMLKLHSCCIFKEFFRKACFVKKTVFYERLKKVKDFISSNCQRTKPSARDALKLKDMILLVNSIIHNKPITTLEA